MASEEDVWVSQAKAGDQAAFEAIVQRYERPIYSFVYRMMGDADDARDLTQDCFIRAYRSLDKTSHDLNISAWLHRIASNACLDVLRRRQRIRWLPWDTTRHEPLLGDSESDSPERHAVAKETSSLVQETLSRMSPRNRAALIMREYEGMSCDEIGDVLGLSRSAVKSVLFRGREEFRKLYPDTEGEARS
ncbi:MAG TPA: RNA polymerase sigma factor [Thermomicrobiales bacterium]|jgi:RNA polymerase sigma-70 factor (ECF subfamily)|nr:RNA polymerase subunit sigma-24 [Chloroflexota bacterium]HQX63959.1 RNA polymerase sigma factor [Thermomicrobiales bacterium]HBY47194.1 RNA polymerase subunit sigma-24 [Chloroflexota bacterium]HCG30298.1 RNA polymerase subunit sigma-24 [Chloroflexota bacterium]HQZ90348.1 RNA polymerase sigma factor [Thermomicrobiales bacterium]